MKIAIIGAGNVGGALAQSSTRAGHQVTISASNIEHAERLANESGARSAPSNVEAVNGAEIVILAVPADSILSIIQELGDGLDGKVVIDVANRPTPDPSGDHCTSSAEEVQASAPGARVIKALNTAFAARQAEPTVAGQQADGYVCGDDQAAKQQVLELVASIGFRPIDVGGLMVARTLEGMAWAHISLQMENKWPFQSAWKIVGPTG